MEKNGTAAPTASAIPSREGRSHGSSVMETREGPREPAAAVAGADEPDPCESSNSQQQQQQQQQQDDKDGDDDDNHHCHHRRGFNLPKLRLEIRDLSHPGASAFLAAVDASTVFATAVRDVVRQLYCLEDPKASPSPSSPAPARPPFHPPPTRSCTLVLRPMDGAAYTTGTDLDDDHKEIHLSLSYVSTIAPARLTDEITGVLVHEFVHCYQWNGLGTCPGGLVEGIADWVRLRCGLAPPHWNLDDMDGAWDRGYHHTAYFLDYLEQRFGPGTVRTINERLRLRKYEPASFWNDLLGTGVDQLWGDYVEKAKQGKQHGEPERAPDAK